MTGAGRSGARTASCRSRPAPRPRTPRLSRAGPARALCPLRHAVNSLDGRLGAPLDSYLDAFSGFRLRRRRAALRLARAQEISCLGDRRPALGPADPEPLCLGEALAPRDLELERRLDALRRGDDAKACAEPRDRTHDGERFLVA